MIRKAVIVVLTISSLAIACVMLGTFIAPQTESLWRSPYWRWNSTLFQRGPTRIELRFRPDYVLISRARTYQCPPNAPMAYSSKAYIDVPGLYFGSVRGPAGRSAPKVSGTSVSSVFVTIRLSVLLPLCTAYPALAFIRGPVRRWRRRKKGLCVKCGYDLTGNVSGVCPECGTRIETRATPPECRPRPGLLEDET